MLSRDSQTIVLHEPDRSPRHQSLARRGNDPAARKLAVAAVCLSALMCVGVVVYTQLTAKATSDKLAWAELELAYFRRVLHDQEVTFVVVVVAVFLIHSVIVVIINIT